MGTSLRTLTKLTNPAMAHWWKKRGIWLMGAVAVCTAVSVLSDLYYSSSPNAPGYSGISSLNMWLQELVGILPGLAPTICVIYAMLAVVASTTACRKLEEESAIPPGAVPIARSFALALQRTWPAFLAYVIISYGWWLAAFVVGNTHPVTSLGLFNWFVVEILHASAAWQLILWFAAFSAISGGLPWLGWVWISGYHLTAYANSLIVSISLIALSISERMSFFDSFDRFSYHIECIWTGLVLLVLALWLHRHKKRWLSAGICLLLAGAGTLGNFAGCLPGIHPGQMPSIVRLSLEVWSQLSFSITKLPFYVTPAIDPSESALVLRSIFPLPHMSLPDAVYFISLVLNLAWLTLLYFFISRVLLREPRMSPSPVSHSNKKAGGV